MQNSQEERQRWRRCFVEAFVFEIGTSYDSFAEPTQKWLDEWARQVQLVENQPSANWGNVVLQLCKAVESELAAGLGRVPSLRFLEKGTLGQKAKRLEQITLDVSTKQQLVAKGIKPEFLELDLPGLLANLAKLRSETDSAHGNATLQSSSAQDAAVARGLSQQILQGLVDESRKKTG